MSHMMAFAAYIGFGLFLRSGIVTYLGRPGLAVIAFLLACSVMWAIVGCFGETTALWPILDPLFEYPQPIPWKKPSLGQIEVPARRLVFVFLVGRCLSRCIIRPRSTTKK
jgi:hypothetical protein